MIDTHTEVHVEPRPKRGWAIAVSALVLGLLLWGHAEIPQIGNLGSLVESFLPWFGLLIPVLLVGALWRRSVVAGAALLIPIMLWLSLFGSVMDSKAQPGGDLTVVSHNVSANNADLVATAHDLIASGADLLALEEMTPDAAATYEAQLAQAYRYHAVWGTVGLWSKLPISESETIDVKVGVPPPTATLVSTDGVPIRGMRATVVTARGPVAVYVAHLGSVGVNPRAGFSTYQRDAGAEALAKAIAADPNERVLLMGDLNGTMDDRAFADLADKLTSVQVAAGDGFGFSWPATFPVVRIDQILVRGVTPKSSWVLPATGSDHRPVGARISLVA
ncbi:endonuclease/exonuclease/phosphatase family protein [Smaragdicoccus niigatensis]|uniref:endonuclease/exonuclease/phosphatase family protein n=1 Tax=Smaragdicoccus niigatensis TaxID=359359 RepID=UPI000372BBCA|nr:endonuclease/exonuclease/phosphatase family protein [Smaragdicoccus niigatensis]